MILGKRVYDPLTNTWSTGYWIPVYNNTGCIMKYVPIWRDSVKRSKYETFNRKG